MPRITRVTSSVTPSPKTCTRAFVTLNEGSDASGDELAGWLNQRVGKHERVSAVVVRGALPKTMIGKLDRKALKAEVLADDSAA